MHTDIDSKGVILALTEGVGAHFGRAARRSFFQQLDRLESIPAFLNRSLSEQQSLVDLLALAAFYQTTVVPLSSSSRFISILNKSGATHLRVGSDKLDRGYAGRAMAARDGFYQILNQKQIPVHLLSYATLREFIAAASDHFTQGE